MKDIIKDYGTIIGPLTAFFLGIFALYIKYVIDRKLEESKSKKKLKKLIRLIRYSTPPNTYHPLKSEIGFHADQARNLTNISIFSKKINVLTMFIEKIESDVLLHCELNEVQQFHHVKFIIKYMYERLENLRNHKEEEKSVESKFNFFSMTEFDFHLMHSDYRRLVKVCDNPQSEFIYAESKSA